MLAFGSMLSQIWTEKFKKDNITEIPTDYIYGNLFQADTK